MTPIKSPMPDAERAAGFAASPLLACPFCGGEARYGETHDGGHFVDCAQCQASSKLIYPSKTDPKPLLQEAWNERHNRDVESALAILSAAHDDHLGTTSEAECWQRVRDAMAILEGIVQANVRVSESAGEKPKS